MPRGGGDTTPRPRERKQTSIPNFARQTFVQLVVAFFTSSRYCLSINFSFTYPLTTEGSVHPGAECYQRCPRYDGPSNRQINPRELLLRLLLCKSGLIVSSWRGLWRQQHDRHTLSRASSKTEEDRRATSNNGFLSPETGPRGSSGLVPLHDYMGQEKTSLVGEILYLLRARFRLKAGQRLYIPRTYPLVEVHDKLQDKVFCISRIRRHCLR